jgi:septum site-determining protein MinD
MITICQQLRKEADFILLDCPAGIEQGFQTAISAADEAIVVATPEMSAVRDADRVIGLLEAKESLTNYKLVLNRVRPQMIQANDMMNVEDVLEILSVKLLGQIPEDQDIIVSTNKGEPVVNNETSLAGQAYRNIARRVAGEDVPFLDLEEPTSWFDRLKQFLKGSPSKSRSA